MSAWGGFKWAEMIAKQEPNPTMDKKLMVTVCTVGATSWRRSRLTQLLRTGDAHTGRPGLWSSRSRAQPARGPAQAHGKRLSFVPDSGGPRGRRLSTVQLSKPYVSRKM